MTLDARRHCDHRKAPARDCRCGPRGHEFTFRPMNAPESLESGPGAFFGDRISRTQKTNEPIEPYGGLRPSLARLRGEAAVGRCWDLRTSTSVPSKPHRPVAFAVQIMRPGPRPGPAASASGIRLGLRLETELVYSRRAEKNFWAQEGRDELAERRGKLTGRSDSWRQ
jgi:hypothetical protein